MSDREMWRNPRCGVRVMPWDPLAVAICAFGVYAAWPVWGQWALVPAYVLGTFFLYCNVFRVRRSYELVWSASFLVWAFALLATGIPTLLEFVGGPLLLTAVLVALEIRSPDYHGIMWDYVHRRRSERTGLL